MKSIQDSPTAAVVFFSVAGFDSTGVVDGVSLAFSDGSDFDDGADFLVSRLSFTYQPEPLNTMPTGCGTRRIVPLHSGHSVSGSSANF